MKSTIYLFLIIIFYACTTQNSSKKTVVNQSQEKETAKDTVQKLNFSSGVRAILEDSKGNFWFGSHQEGVAKFDGKIFTYFTTANGLTDNQVRSIQEDKNGNIWFGTASGVDSYNGKKLTNHRWTDALDIFANKDIGWKVKPDDLWFNAGTSKGVYRHDGKELTYLPFPNPKDKNLNYQVTGIAKGQNNQVWFATYPAVIGYTSGLSLLSNSNFKFIDNDFLGLKGEDAWLHVRSIFEDSKGNLWFGNNGIGVYLYNGKEFVNFTEQQGLSIQQKGKEGSMARIFSINEDKDGNMWFGSRDNGIWKYDGEKMTNYHKEAGLTTSMVWAIYNDKKGRVWIGLADGAVLRFNGERFNRVY